ncbi:Polyketide synthase [Hondaea fermentalgiana]|uniref:Polyketide synthase n=1 Tax=Hondaea fermentalgiana TaxID=2315210 RepID=A0A2R5GGM0_9STRA|nr:Polyketide synthase [Hondaea fermentalgiana]|eukprot:GBG27411.1 Polyketide synthase [Hondaea fermentalgiana]
MTDIPLGRFDWEKSSDRLYARKAAFVDNVDRFDANKFKIAPVEAQQMDPQQRLALEVASEALEDAQLDADARVGVFVGVMTNDWARLMDPAKPTAYSASVLPLWRWTSQLHR